MHYFKFNIGDYSSHAQHLTLIEDLAYRRMLETYYLQERPLHIGIAAVARQIRMREHEDAVGAVLAEFFTLTDDGWINPRADREISEFKAKIEQTSNAGKASAASRFNVRSTDAQLNTNHKPRTNNHEPRTTKHEPEPKNQETQNTGTVSPSLSDVAVKKLNGYEKPLSRPTWDAYCEAYSVRYGAAPVRNAKVNAQLSHLVGRLGSEEAPAVARFYVWHQGALYVRSGHATDLLLRDAEKLRTEWATGHSVHNRDAIEADRLASVGASTLRSGEKLNQEVKDGKWTPHPSWIR